MVSTAGPTPADRRDMGGFTKRQLSGSRNTSTSGSLDHPGLSGCRGRSLRTLRPQFLLSDIPLSEEKRGPNKLGRHHEQDGARLVRYVLRASRPGGRVSNCLADTLTQTRSDSFAFSPQSKQRLGSNYWKKLFLIFSKRITNSRERRLIHGRHRQAPPDTFGRARRIESSINITRHSQNASRHKKSNKRCRFAPVPPRDRHASSRRSSLGPRRSGPPSS